MRNDTDAGAKSQQEGGEWDSDDGKRRGRGDTRVVMCWSKPLQFSGVRRNLFSKRVVSESVAESFFRKCDEWLKVRLND